MLYMVSKREKPGTGYRLEGSLPAILEGELPEHVMDAYRFVEVKSFYGEGEARLRLALGERKNDEKAIKTSMDSAEHNAHSRTVEYARETGYDLIHILGCLTRIVTGPSYDYSCDYVSATSSTFLNAEFWKKKDGQKE